MASYIKGSINNEADLNNAYGNHHQKLVVLEYMVPWSELCKFMSPAVEELAKEHQDHADFYTLDTDKWKEHAREKRVEVLPTFLLLKDGKECKRIVGLNKEELDKSIKEHSGGQDKGAPVLHGTLQVRATASDGRPVPFNGTLQGQETTLDGIAAPVGYVAPVMHMPRGRNDRYRRRPFLHLLLQDLLRRRQ